jgi:hypothetical protein
MSMNILNDISAVYLEQVSAASRARNAVADDRLDAEQKKTNASMNRLRQQSNSNRVARVDAAAAARKVESDVKNSSAYGPQRPKPGTVTGRRIEETVIDEAKKRKIKRWWDDDGNGIGYEEGEVSGKFKRKKVKESSDYDPMDDDDFDHDEAEENRGVSGKNNPKGGKALGKKKKSKGMKEGFSNWRQDLSEVMDDIEASKEIKEKKNINNKVKTSAMGGGIKLGEAVEQLGGELIEMVEVELTDKAGAAAAGAGAGSLKAGNSPAAAAGRAAGTFVRKMTKEELELQEKSESEQQQKLFGLALSVKRGDTPRSEVSDAVLKIVDSMSEKKIRDFAKTKHEGIPKKVEEELAPTTSRQFAAQRQLSMAQKRVTAADQAALGLRKKEMQQQQQQQQEEFVSEEDYDRMKDERMMRGGVDGNTNYRKPAKTTSTKPVDPEHRKKIVQNALKFVRQQTMSKYGKGSLM